MTLRLATVLLALLAACGGDGGGDAAEEPGSAAVPRPGPLVVLVRSGGIAGATDQVSVDASGVATVISDRSPNPSTRTLSATDLATLRAALERAEIATLQRNYLDRRARDAYQYDITYQGVTVTADEGVLPPKLRPVVDQLVRLVPP